MEIRPGIKSHKTGTKEKNMTGYQKLKIENAILWGELEDWLYEFAKTRTEDKDEQKEIVEKEMAYIEWRIEGETK